MMSGYTINNSLFDVYLAAAFGILGYVLAKFDCEPAPLMLGFVLGPMVEESFRRSMVLSAGDPSIFVRGPISTSFLVVTTFLAAVMLLPSVRARRNRMLEE